MKILFLGDIQHPNSQNWISAFRTYGHCEVISWTLPWPKGYFGKLKRILSYLFAFISIRRIIAKEKPDILIGYRLTSYGFLAAITGFKALVIAQQGETDVWPPGHWTEPFKALLAKYAIKKALLIHAWGDHMAKAIFDLGGDRHKVLIMPRGIDLNNFTVNDSSKSFDELRIIVTRALYKEYGHDIIIRALHKLSEHKIPVKLFIAGTGIEEPDLKNLVSELNMEQLVTFGGRLSNDALKEQLLSANVYVSMPVTDGVSASLLEAMACYCVPVVSDLAANRMWIDDKKNGFIVPLNDVEKLYDILMYIWQHKTSFQPMLHLNRQLVEEKGSQQKNTKIFLAHYQLMVNNIN